MLTEADATDHGIDRVEGGGPGAVVGLVVEEDLADFGFPVLPVGAAVAYGGERLDLPAGDRGVAGAELVGVVVPAAAGELGGGDAQGCGDGGLFEFRGPAAVGGGERVGFGECHGEEGVLVGEFDGAGAEGFGVEGFLDQVGEREGDGFTELGESWSSQWPR